MSGKKGALTLGLAWSRDKEIRDTDAPNTHTPYLKFYRQYAGCLETILVNHYLSHIDLDDISLSCITSPDNEMGKVKLILIPAELSADDPGNGNIAWDENTLDDECLKSMAEMFQDIASVCDRFKLNISARTSSSGAPHILETSNPNALMTLLRELIKKIDGLTLDDYHGKTLLAPRHTIQSMGLKYLGQEDSRKKTPDNPFREDDINLEYMPPLTFLSPLHAFVGISRAARRGTLPFSIAQMQELLNEERRKPPTAGCGLVLFH